MAIINLFSSNSFGSHVHLEISVDIIEQDFFQTQPQSYASIVTAWNTYKIQMIRISVDFLHRISISRTSDFDTLSSVIYDGPNSMVAYLNTYQNTKDRIHYISSTHQVYIVCVHIPNISTFRFNYTKYGYPAARALRPNELITLSNNTGCGYNSPSVWVCTFNISSKHREHAVLRLISFDITGPFTNMPTSAGIAIYNVINNNAVLVYHWYNSKEGNVAITSTENQLIFSVYAYSRIANVSCRLSTGASNCVGIILQRHLKTSIVQITENVVYEILPPVKKKTRFVATFNVKYNCFFIQTNDLSTKPDVASRHITQVFVHNLALNITKHFEDSDMRYSTFKINGDYKLIYAPNTAKPKSQSFIGPIKSLEFFYGQAPIEFFMVSQVPCMLPCHDISNVAASMFGIVKLCDICNFVFIDNVACNNYTIIQDKTITFERILGDLPLNILIWSVEYESWEFSEDTLITLALPDYFAYYISYYADRLVLQLEEKRVVMVDVTNNELWRIPRGSLEIYQRSHIHKIHTIPRKIKVFRLGIYEYFVAGGSRLTGWTN